jgi:serine/threonine protein phosphatase PrpC
LLGRARPDTPKRAASGASLLVETELARLSTAALSSGVGCHTDPGARPYQEDAAWSTPLGERDERVLMVIADGAGGESDTVTPGTVVQLPQGGSVALRRGATSGHLAAWIAAESVRTCLGSIDLNQVNVARAVRTAFELAQRNVTDQARGGVTTLTVAVLEPSTPGQPRNVVLGHVGDSPAYRVTYREVALLQGRLHHHPRFGHVLTRAIGHTDAWRTRPDIVERTIAPGEKFVMGSDGIEPVQRMLALLLRRDQRPQQAAEVIVQKAVELGGQRADNASVLIWENVAEPAAPANVAGIQAAQA